MSEPSIAGTKIGGPNAPKARCAIRGRPQVAVPGEQEARIAGARTTAEDIKRAMQEGKT